MSVTFGTKNTVITNFPSVKLEAETFSGFNGTSVNVTITVDGAQLFKDCKNWVWCNPDGKHIFIVVVDTGDNGDVVVTGISTLQLAKILQALGSFNAMNFDGGGFSTMSVKKHDDNGRVNFSYRGTC